jgi:L-fuconolactonase
LAVVGWAPIAEPTFPQSLALLQQNEKLKGLRHLVQAEPAGFLFSDAFNRGIAAIGETSLVYEILIYERQLRESIAFVDRHPRQQFVLDHIAKPKIAAGEIESWAQSIRELSRRENVVCKLSGMVTEADWKQWRDEDLTPYVDVVLDAFDSQRLMWGSDWPVCLVASSYERWVKFVEQSISKLSDDEQADILGRTAARTYGLDSNQ